MSVAQFDANKGVGARVRRREDPRFLQGKGSYVDDLQRAGMLHAAFVRADVAHGEIKSIDVEAARAVPGVVDVFTGQDLAEIVSPVVAQNELPGYQEHPMQVLPTDRVRYPGEPIAIVVAEDRYEAEDGADAVVVDVDPLPALSTIEAATAPGAPAIHEEIPDNLFNHFTVEHGDVKKAFADADFTIESELRSQRVAPVPLEPRAVMAEWDHTGSELSVWATHQAPHMFRTGLAEFLSIPEGRIRVVSPDVGGGFGTKMIVYAEDLAVAGVARLTQRAVRWTSDRREDLLSCMHSREQIHRIEAAVREDGRVLGVRIKIMASNGAHAIWPMTAGLDSGQASENVTGPYDIPNYERDVYAVVTNRTPMGPYRGVGRVSACFSIERTMDKIAQRLEIEPLEVRRRNVVRSYPHETATELVLESGSSAESLDRMEELFELEAFRAEQRRLREQGIYRGIGVAAAIEHSSHGPEELAKKGIPMGLGSESACVRVEPDGHVTLIVGSHSHGQGHETTYAQIVAQELEVPHENVTVRFGDTAVAPYGTGTWASRSTVYAGGASILASRAVREKSMAIAASQLEVSVEDVEMSAGSVTVKGSPSTTMSFAEIARIANHKPQLLPPEIEPGLESTNRYRAPDPGSFANALHGAIVEVDIATGAVEIKRYVVIEDCGVMVNPLLVEGQIHGGVAQGLGHALLEHAAYDENGQPLATSFMDYLVPGFNEVPKMEVEHFESPSPNTLGGFKGMGEGGAINPPATIANAVSDALSPFGINVDQTPITPQSIVDAVEAAGGNGGAGVG